MTDEDKIEAAARGYCVNDAWSKDECGADRDQRHFKAGVAWRDKNIGPHVMALVELMRSVNVQQIVNGKAGQALAATTISIALAQFEKAVKGD